MNTSDSLTAFCRTAVYVLLLVFSTSAATEQWRLDGWSRIMQVMADGAGGAAFFRMETNGTAAAVVWADKKGAIIYQHENLMEFPSPIISCTKKELVFSRVSGTPTNESIVIAQVDKKGNEQIIAEPGKYLIPPVYVYGPSDIRDRKGFFAVSMTTNQPYRSELIRYSRK